MLVLYSSFFHVSFSIDSSDRAFAGDLEEVIATSDVILEVLDARDPLGTRCVNIEKRVRDSGTYKRHVLLLNKIGKFLDHLFLPFSLLGIFFSLTNHLCFKFRSCPSRVSWEVAQVPSRRIPYCRFQVQYTTAKIKPREI